MEVHNTIKIHLKKQRELSPDETPLMSPSIDGQDISAIMPNFHPHPSQ
jgi:hypothetical protein